MSRLGVGLLYPGFGAEDDFSALESRFEGSLRLPLVHTSVGEDAHRVDALLDLGSGPRLAEGAEALRPYLPDSVLWACTSGSFVFGWEGARQQADAIGERLGVPASSTSIAFVNAVRALGMSRVAVAASYPADVARSFVEFLAAGEIEVTWMESHGIATAKEVSLLDRADVVGMAQAADTSTAEALLIPDTAMHSLAWLDELERAAGIPVLTANQVTIWEGCALVGEPPRLDSLGTLFNPPGPARSRGER